MRGSKQGRGKLIAVLVVGAVFILMVAWFVSQAHVAVFEPKGEIAEKQRALMITALLLSVIVVVPVYAMTIGIAWKYRAGNKKARYSPDWDHNRVVETAWWLIPLTLIGILSVITWQASHALDPFKPLASDKKPLNVQVVALQWKWLFIYPEQNIASVNFLQLPVDTPVNFQITSDGPMNSFWIPQLGGQVYAMSGMSTKLHLMTNTPGDYRGSSANISGEGFASMRFTARASNYNDFAAWVNSVKESPTALTGAVYETLAAPSINNPQTFYRQTADGLYNKVVMQFMDPSHSPANRDQHQQEHRDYEVQP